MTVKIIAVSFLGKDFKRVSKIVKEITKRANMDLASRFSTKPNKLRNIATIIVSVFPPALINMPACYSPSKKIVYLNAERTRRTINNGTKLFILDWLVHEIEHALQAEVEFVDNDTDVWEYKKSEQSAEIRKIRSLINKGLTDSDIKQREQDSKMRANLNSLIAVAKDVNESSIVT